MSIIPPVPRSLRIRRRASKLHRKSQKLLMLLRRNKHVSSIEAKHILIIDTVIPITTTHILKGNWRICFLCKVWSNRVTEFTCALDPFGKIELRFASFESESSFIVSKSCSFSSFKSSKPYPRCLLRIANLCSPLPPWTLPHSSIVSSSYTPFTFTTWLLLFI
ncbi:hypothetical protein CR513_31221, partial [Mucuna pruriens]